MSAEPVEVTVEKRSRYDVESLLAVAVEVFGERGYDGTSMDDLARAAGITKSSFYHHVKGKEELLRRSLDRALGGLFAALEAAEAGEGAAVRRLEELLRGSVALLVAELPHVTLLLRVRGNTETERSALARRREFDHRVTALVAAAEAEGDLRISADPALAARLVFGLINSLTEWYRPGGELGEAALADAVVELALSGLRVRPAE
ncbi:TetR/AcrR family transcriptional regulator [Sporichthya sp.]|uniref:TetR/AcrR family transcriptional regulator n=1 Tax=Sporichthya sp. TaxID=65475 RepID=UPI00179B3C56|nr:TetR/AcrR family transcriptional regulator [Sporichthya sp.]MBA3742756.1 TetR/AcrR family transcriptional regulator [Sporichthya sp.]